MKALPPAPDGETPFVALRRVETLPHNIEVAVAYYNDDEKTKLLEYPTREAITALVRDGISLPIAEFLTYYLFRRKRVGKAGWDSYVAISRRINDALADLNDFVEFTDRSINSVSDIGIQDPRITESVGESIGLSVVNRLHHLTGADWERIPEARGPDAHQVFDYETKAGRTRASDGRYVIQVETKGSSVEDPSRLSSALYQQKAKIAKKKDKIREREQLGKYPHPAQLRYGTVTALGSRSGSVVRCLLVDPVGDGELPDPRQFRILNRLRFLYDWIAFISSRSVLASSLATRLEALSALGDLSELDGVPLMKGNGEPLRMTRGPGFLDQVPFFSGKSHVTDGFAAGHALQLSGDHFYFLGVQEDLVLQAVDQDFNKILEYRAESATISKRVRCVFTPARAQSLELPGDLRRLREEDRSNFSFVLSGDLHYSPDGLVHGLLPVTSLR